MYNTLVYKFRHGDKPSSAIYCLHFFLDPDIRLQLFNAMNKKVVRFVREAV